MKIKDLIEILNNFPEEDKERVIVDDYRKCVKDVFFKMHDELNIVKMGFRHENESTKKMEPDNLLNSEFVIINGIFNKDI